MSTHRALTSWQRTSQTFDAASYNREFTWTFKNGLKVNAAAAPDYKGSPECVDPEEAFVASVSGCHMLTFLALAAKKKWVVDAYEDKACGFLEKNADGFLSITRIELRPRIRFGGDAPPAEAVNGLHQRAHQHCFIASSVRSEITVIPA